MPEILNRFEFEFEIGVFAKSDSSVIRRGFHCLLFQLQSDNILNLDTILEDILQQLVIPPLRPHILTLYVTPVTSSPNTGASTSSSEVVALPAAESREGTPPKDLLEDLRTLTENIHLSLLQKLKILHSLAKNVADMVCFHFPVCKKKPLFNLLVTNCFMQS